MNRGLSEWALLLHTMVRIRIFCCYHLLSVCPQNEAASSSTNERRATMIMLLKLLNLAFIAITCNASAPMSSPFRQSLLTPIVVGVRRATRNTQRRGISSTAITANSHDVVSRGGAAKTCCDGKPPVKLLRWAYAAAGLATTAGWGTMVYTSIRDNQPVGAMMPCEFGI